MILDVDCNVYKKRKGGDSIISVPAQLIITTETVLQSSVGKILIRKSKQLQPCQLLCVFLIYEYLKFEKSEWHPYISSLPRTYYNVVNWSEEDITWLPKYLQHTANAMVEDLRTSYEDVYRHIEDAGELLAHVLKDLSFDLYKWAWNVVNTRCVYMDVPPSENVCSDEPNNSALIPFLDFLNHSADVNVTAGYCEEKNHYEIVTHTTYNKYSQLFICYGPHDNARLLLEYGFLLPRNGHNAVVISTADLLELHKQFAFSFFKEKLSYLQETDFISGLVITNTELSWALHLALKLFACQSGDRQFWETLEVEEKLEYDVVPICKAMLKLKCEQLCLSGKEAKNENQALCAQLCTQLLAIIDDFTKVENTTNSDF